MVLTEQNINFASVPAAPKTSYCPRVQTGPRSQDVGIEIAFARGARQRKTLAVKRQAAGGG